MAKHTPGPWKLIELDGITYINPDRGEDEYALIARITGPNLASGRHEANARLIAAAPDALAACKMALAYLNHAGTENFERGGDRHVREVLEAAIRKAEE